MDAPRRVVVPGDKSLTHRALMLAALASGDSRIRSPLRGADTQSTAAVLRACGCHVPSLDGDPLVIRGRGLRGLQAPPAALDCGNSGTTARLMMGILAGCDFAAVLSGDASLRSRPMRRVTTPLAAMGARFRELDAPDRLPVEVTGGALRETHYTSPHASAQVKSAILLAALVGGVRASVTEPILSRDHTERMLATLGATLRRSPAGTGVRVEIDPAADLGPLDFDVPADFSSAAFVLALATLAGTRAIVPGVGVNPTRTGFLDVLRRMGGQVRLENRREACGEPVADLHVEPAELAATTIDGAEVPSLVDEIPVIAILAARARGETVISGAGELRVKESDRIAAVVSNLRAAGVDAEELPDGMVIRGTRAPLAGDVRTLHDHRIAMAFGVLAAAGNARLHVDLPDVVDVSFPGFWRMLEEFARA